MRDRREADSGVIKGAETIDLQEEGSRGVLLLHGFGDTPQTLSLLARRLHKAGYSVLAPLLPGHGRSLRDFTESSADQWIDAATLALMELRRRSGDTSIVGLSMGGAVAVVLAAKAEITSLVLIAPYLGMPLGLRLASATHWLWGRAAGAVNARNPRSIHDPIEREKNLAYGAVTGSALSQLWKVVRRARNALPSVTAPTLIIQSREDPRISMRVAQSAVEMLGAAEKRLILTEGSGHIITVDYGRERVFSEVTNWLASHTSRKVTAAGD